MPSEEWREEVMTTSKRFTLVELLTVLAIIAILIAILLPALGNAKQQAYKAVCMSRLIQIEAANIMYVQDQDGLLPPATVSVVTPSGNGHFNWTSRRVLGPYLENDHGWFISKDCDVLACPSARGLAVSESPNHFTSRGIGMSVDRNGTSSQYRLFKTIVDPDKTAGFTDAMSYRWVGRGVYHYYFDDAETWVNHWGYGAYGSAYNYSRRHFNKANVVFTDGHTESFSNFYEAYQARQLKSTWKEF